MNNNNKLSVNKGNSINAALAGRSFMPKYIGRFLGENSKAVAFLNIQSPIKNNKDPTNASGKKVTTNSSIAMSVIHLLVIPKEYKYNAVTLMEADVPLVKSMHRLGLKVGKELVRKLKVNMPSVSGSGMRPNFASMSNKKTNITNLIKNRKAPEDSDFLTGFHVWPSHSTGHLHMHVVYKPWKSAGYDGQIGGKLITTETLLKVLGDNGNGNGNGNGIVDGSMSKADFEAKQKRFGELLFRNFNAEFIKASTSLTENQKKKILNDTSLTVNQKKKILNDTSLTVNQKKKILNDTSLTVNQKEKILSNNSLTVKILNNNLKNASKGLILGNYISGNTTVPFGAFRPSPLNNDTRGQLNKIRQKIRNHANGKNVYLKTLPYAAYTNKLRKPNNNK
jgi:hypothetical protein